LTIAWCEVVPALPVPVIQYQRRRIRIWSGKTDESGMDITVSTRSSSELLTCDRGRRLRLFGDGFVFRRLRLVESRVTGTGAITGIYAPAQAV
jgi:hypothetical protein